MTDEQRARAALAEALELVDWMDENDTYTYVTFRTPDGSLIALTLEKDFTVAAVVDLN